MQTSPDLPTTVDFGNNLVNYIEVSSDDVLSRGDEPVATTPAATPLEEEAPDEKGDKAEEEGPEQRPQKQLPPPEAFSRNYPQYLKDFEDEQPEAVQLAESAIEKLDTPPTLPGFLAKPILNAATLMKDDNSVLNMPNHTTLNHLATSSIKNGTLAVSATTRYRDKVCGSKDLWRYDTNFISSMSQRSCTNRWFEVKACSCLAGRSSRGRPTSRQWLVALYIGPEMDGKGGLMWKVSNHIKAIGSSWAFNGFGRIIQGPATKFSINITRFRCELCAVVVR